MPRLLNCTKTLLVGLLAVAPLSFAQAPTGELKAKVDAKLKELASWSTNAEVVAAVRAYNANPPAEAKSLSNDKWKQLTPLDPYVRSFSKNAVATAIKANKPEYVTECF